MYTCRPICTIIEKHHTLSLNTSIHIHSLSHPHSRTPYTHTQTHTHRHTHTYTLIDNRHRPKAVFTETQVLMCYCSTIIEELWQRLCGISSCEYFCPQILFLRVSVRRWPMKKSRNITLKNLHCETKINIATAIPKER